MQTESRPSVPAWIPTRDEALRRLAAFVPAAGRTYAAQRNYDRGPGERGNVSQLSPYLRHRIVTETEVLSAVLARHSLAAAEKFVQEVCWRTYWKGWLEAHPAAWQRYRATLDRARADRDASPTLRARVAQAMAGRTGIDAFDAWARELGADNYLHNHARMWFASIWIFTLGLPWELGADLFMRQLLDGDPASNTLSWRWVAGLHTRGKTYAATRDNIRRYTGERFRLDTALARAMPALHDEPLPEQPLGAVPGVAAGNGPALLLLHDDDFHGDLCELPADIRGVIALTAVAGRSPEPVSPAVAAFVTAAAGEAARRIATVRGAVDAGTIDAADEVEAAVAAAAADCGASRIVAPFAPVGPVRDRLDRLRPALAARGLVLELTGRRYDAAAWPAATRGFFGLRARIPALVAELGLGAG